MPKKIKQTAALLLCLSLLLGLLAGCRDSGSQQQEEQVQGSTIGEEIQDIDAADNVFSLNSDQSGTFHPYTDTSVLNHLFMPLVFETMYELSGSFEASPKLITRAETTDGMIWSPPCSTMC